MIFPIRLGLIIGLGRRRRVDPLTTRLGRRRTLLDLFPGAAGTADPYRNLATLLWNHFPALR